MPDFWMSSGYHFLDRNEKGYLEVTDAFLKLYLARPEITPIEDSCAAERALHQALLADPQRHVNDHDLADIADAAAQENYRVWLDLRDRLQAAGTIEQAYVTSFRSGEKPMPGLFLDQFATLILRNLLEGADNAYRARAAELFFRPQRVTIEEGTILLADEEIIDQRAAGRGFGALGQLIAQSGTPLAQVELDILGDHNLDQYWLRSDRHDMVLDLSFARPGLDAFCRMLEIWIDHLLGLEVQIEPVQRIRDERWVWHVGLDAQASMIMNDLYEGREVDDSRQQRILSLFRLSFRDPNQMLARVRGRPIYLAIAMDETGRLRVKPQNLLVNLPLAEIL